MNTPNEQSEPLKPFEIYVDGDYIVDFLVPKESIIPFSTKDPTISGLSAEREQMIKAVPGGAWTIDKMLQGISDAWTQWYAELYKAMSSPKPKPPESDDKQPEFVKLRVPGSPMKSVAPVPLVKEEEDWNIQERSLFERKSLTEHREYEASENNLDAADEHWFSWHFAPCPQGSPIDDKTVYRGVGIVAKKKPLNQDAQALIKSQILRKIPGLKKADALELRQALENDNGCEPLKAFKLKLENLDKDAVIEKLKASILKVIPHFDQGPRAAFDDCISADHKLFVFMDYDADLRYREPDAKIESIFKLPPHEQFPCRVFIMCSSLPGDGYRCEVREPGKEPIKEMFYDKLPEEAKAGSVMIVGMDMLRLAGADVAYDQSWDRILDDFYREKEICPELKKLCEYEHLIVRVGVTGAIYHHTPWERKETALNTEGKPVFGEDGKPTTKEILEPKLDQAKCRLIYDPNAPKSWFRAPNEQGNILGSRSCFGGCVVARLVQGLTEQKDIFKLEIQQKDQSHFAQELIVRGIKDAICMAEALYHEGLGNDPTKLKDYTTATHYREVYFKKVLASDHDSLEKLRQSKPKVWRRVLEQELPQRSRYVAHISAPLDDSPLEWGIYRSALRMGISEGAVIPKPPPSLDAHLDFITEQRRLWLAMMVARCGHEFVLNSVENHYRYQEELRRFDAIKLQRIDLVAKGRCAIFDETVKGFLEKKAGPESKTADDANKSRDSFIAYAKALGGIDTWKGGRDTNQVVDQDWEEPSDLFEKVVVAKRELTGSQSDDAQKTAYEKLRHKLQFIACVYPFNAPVAQFGDITVVGQWEAETYSNLRNLLVNHLSKCSKDRKAPRPLSIAVFGGPGSGKSFGVKAIAEFIGTRERLSMMEFNVSQFANRQDLDSAFLRVSDALAKKMIPLVFWDEFDCSFPGGGSFGWLSYFLGPMQDGTYHHPGGALHLAGSIFVFAGGTHSCFREFQDHAMGGGESIELSPSSSDASAQIAKERKFPDFISRLRGFLDVPSLNRREPGSKYSPEEREMPYLNRAQTLRYLLKKRGLLAKTKLEDREIEVAQIHPDIIEAFLTVNRYQHGKRSMEALVESCVIMKEELMEASFPTNPQLDMHTWGAEFRERMHLPGSYWITDYLFIPSRVPNPKSRKEVFFPVQEWELVDYCHKLLGSAALIPELLGELLSKICHVDSDVYLRTANMIECVEHHREYLAKILNLGSLEVEPSYAPSSPKAPDPFNCYIRPHEVWLDGCITPDMQSKRTLSIPNEEADDDSGWIQINHPLNGLKYDNKYVSPKSSDYFVIQLAMLEEKQTVNLRLHIRRKAESVKVLLTSDCTRLRFHSGVGRNPLENEGQRPTPADLWTHQWSWRKMDKARVLRHILKNLYIAVHGELKWKEKEKDMHDEAIEAEKRRKGRE